MLYTLVGSVNALRLLRDDGSEWTHDSILETRLEYLHGTHHSKVLAFAMGSHDRLESESVVRLLNSAFVHMVFWSFFQVASGLCSPVPPNILRVTVIFSSFSVCVDDGSSLA